MISTTYWATALGIVLGLALLATGCRPIGASPGVITFFYVVNMSGRDVRIRVAADSRELFLLEMEALRRATPAHEGAPPPGPYPARELKVALPPDVKDLTVEELNSGMRVTFEIPHGVQSDAGFRLTIAAQSIEVARDYMSIQSR